MLLRNGIPLNWYIDVPLEHPAFVAVQTLAMTLTPGNENDLLFRPDEPISTEDWQAWRLSAGGNAPEHFEGTRGEAALEVSTLIRPSATFSLQGEGETEYVAR